jgi:Suppressor of fused protein (SUFU)
MSFFKKIFGSNLKEEKSESGSAVYRYTDIGKDGDKFTPADGVEHIDEITEHIEKYIGPAPMVLHEIISDKVHLDIHVVYPTEERPYYVLVTSGMSDKPMTVPEGCEKFQYAELYMMLPADWPADLKAGNMEDEAFKEENNYWPIRWMKKVARFPHMFDTWMAWGHTLPNGEDAEPFAPNTKLGCIMLYPSYMMPKELLQLTTRDGTLINFLCMIPLYREEMLYKLKHGADALLELFDQNGIDDVIRPGRKNVAL